MDMVVRFCAAVREGERCGKLTRELREPHRQAWVG